MKQKTYGVYGLMEWSVLLKMGKKQFHINFTEGSSSTAGVIPATYTTNNPIIQLAVESSKLFKDHQIKLIGEVSLEEDEKKTVVEGSAENVANGTVVKVSCLDDAKDYLSDTCGAKREKLISKKSILAVAKQNGIVFEGL